MRNKKRVTSILMALLLSIGMIAGSCLFSIQTKAENSQNQAVSSKYESLNINDITGTGKNPPEITGDASAYASNKPWYEYIMYSDQPVSSFRLNDDWRLIFYDPYEYSGSMVMEVTGEESAWSSANSITVSYTSTNSMTDGYSSGTSYSSSVQIQDGRDETSVRR